MRASWSDWVKVCLIYEEWESWPSKPGVYIIRASRCIPRIGGTDKTGMLYLGKASNLRSRIWSFWKAEHNASGFLWEHRGFARLVLDLRILTVTDVEKCLGRLTVRYATPLYGPELARAERALLFSYINSFGEAPPLNHSVGRRWDSEPPAQDLRWAEIGIETGT